MSWRARRRGWRGWYEPAAVAYHRRGGSGRDARLLGRRLQLLGRSDEVAYHIVKNRFQAILKNESLPQLIARMPLYLGHHLPRLMLLALLRPRVILMLLSSPRVFSSAWSRRNS